jgi:hypothetical protein
MQTDGMHSMPPPLPQGIRNDARRATMCGQRIAHVRVWTSPPAYEAGPMHSYNVSCSMLSNGVGCKCIAVGCLCQPQDAAGPLHCTSTHTTPRCRPQPGTAHNCTPAPLIQQHASPPRNHSTIKACVWSSLLQHHTKRSAVSTQPQQCHVRRLQRAKCKRTAPAVQARLHAPPHGPPHPTISVQNPCATIAVQNPHQNTAMDAQQARIETGPSAGAVQLPHCTHHAACTPPKTDPSSRQHHGRRKRPMLAD